MRINARKGLAPIVVLIIGLLVVGGGGFGIKKMMDKKKAGTKAPTVETPMPVSGTETSEMVAEDTITEPSEITVIYDANGFVPKTITVKREDTIVFQNKTGKRASVASNPHPTHTIYPEFDQYKTEQRGKDEFRFSFEKVGTWKYHDHLNSTMTGTVIVE